MSYMKPLNFNIGYVGEPKCTVALISIIKALYFSQKYQVSIQASQYTLIQKKQMKCSSLISYQDGWAQVENIEQNYMILNK